MSKASFINAIVVGNLSDEYTIDISGKANNHICGGSLLYAASGVKSRTDQVGLVSRIHPDYPADWLKSIESKGFDIRGILKTKTVFDHRRFFMWRDAEHFDSDNPVAHFASHGLTFPHGLLGYHNDDSAVNDSVWGNAVGQLKIHLPREFLDVTSAHLCPLDFSTQAKMINLLESGSANTLSISPSNQYMRPEYLDKLQVIVKGTAVFAPTENQLASLCSSQTDDIWEMMEIITDLGCQRVVVSRGMKGYLMFDAASKKRYHLPVYPNRWVNPTGAEDVFAGAFLSELTATYDASRALVWGCAMASIAVEGSGPFYCLEAIPGLADARAMKLQSYLGSV